MRQLAIYAKINDFQRIGMVSFMYDRIVQYHATIPVHKKQIPKLCEDNLLVERIETVSESHEMVMANSFSIQKISKAEPAYQKFGLTHKLECRELKKIYPNELYIKLTPVQLAYINFYNKRYIWQSKTFRHAIYTELIKFLIVTLLSMLILILFKS